MWSSALEDALFRRAPGGWTFNSPYPRIFSRQLSTYLLTDVEKERLAGGLRRGLQKVQIVLFGVCVLAAVPLAFRLPDVLRALRAGSPGAWLLVFLVFVLIGGMLASAVVITHYRLIHPILRGARRIGPADPDSVISLLTETTPARKRIVRLALLLLTCGFGAYLSAHLSPSSPDADLLLVLSILLGLVAVWDAALLAGKLRARKTVR